VWARAFARDADPVRVYLVVIDGLRPDEVGFMPQVAELAAEGTYWPDGRAERIAETTPNHVAMLTGMRGDRHGMPGNAVPARPGFTPQLGDEPRYLKADTLFTLLRRQAPRHGHRQRDEQDLPVPDELPRPGRRRRA
jgi:ectonucleotide pyrophosphatase/phosphodiesterase family member 5